MSKYSNGMHKEQVRCIKNMMIAGERYTSLTDQINHPIRTHLHLPFCLVLELYQLQYY